MSHFSTNPSATRPPLSINPAILFDQAWRVNRWCVRSGDGGCEPCYLLAFLRGEERPQDEPAHSAWRGRWQIAVYFCDEQGRVLDWRRRFDLWAVNCDDAMFKLMYGIENDLVVPTPIEQLRACTDPHDTQHIPHARQRFERLLR